MRDFLTLEKAAQWASDYVGKEVSKSNISYLIQYGRIRKYDEYGNLKIDSSGSTTISLNELKQYYDSNRREREWRQFLGKDISWKLSFDNIRESQSTKHVHRLHPYKGKFIPQLVEYFLDNHTNDFKQVASFKKGDVILDPFVGSGTTLVQCLELGLHSIGIDISKFNCMISLAKIQKYNIANLERRLQKAASATGKFSMKNHGRESARDLHIDRLISSLNQKYYPNPDFKIFLRAIRQYDAEIQSHINKPNGGVEGSKQDVTDDFFIQHQDKFSIIEEKIESFTKQNSTSFHFRITPENIKSIANEFTKRYSEIVLQELNRQLREKIREEQTKFLAVNEKQLSNTTFLPIWFAKRQRAEMGNYLEQIHHQSENNTKRLMKIILSRTARSCRATKHVDLATLTKPQSEPYYCRKHYKICRPVSTIIGHLRKYTDDTIKRIEKFSRLRKATHCEVINADSRTLDILTHIKDKNRDFYKLLERNKIDGIFTSPPYVGNIDYHEQHAYSYELFDIERKDTLEIGRKSNGTSKKAQSDYINGISNVLVNMKKYLKDTADIFIVANDKRNLFPGIAKRSDLNIEEVFRRPVLNRTERDKQPYSESIFHMKL